MADLELRKGRETFEFPIADAGLRKGKVRELLPYFSEIRFPKSGIAIARCRKAWSQSTRAAIASTIGTARGRTQGSWRPRAASVVSSPDAVTVFCSRERVAVGLNATRKKISSQLLIPPCTPPELFVVVRTLSSRTSNGSLCSEPFIRVAAKPDPISKPFEAGKLRIA